MAVSGGRDSTALLHATLRAALPLGLQVWALHVHHGLQAEADAWEQQVRQQARRWGAAFLSQRLRGAPGPGDSVLLSCPVSRAWHNTACRVPRTWPAAG